MERWYRLSRIQALLGLIFFGDMCLAARPPSEQPFRANAMAFATELPDQRVLKVRLDHGGTHKRRPQKKDGAERHPF